MLPILRDDAPLAPIVGGPINRLESFFGHVFGEDGPVGRAWGTLPLAMWEDEDHVFVEAEVPGMTDRDLEVTVHNGMLFIRGVRTPEEGRRYLYNGRSYGRFERVISLPEAVESDDVKAELTDGLLRIMLPKSPAAKPRKIALTKS